jgi:uncharacterized protein
MTTPRQPTPGAIEHRHWQHPLTKPRVERRSDDEAAPKVITGYAAVFYRAGDPATEYRLWQDAYERVLPGCFDAAIREQDIVRGLCNHKSEWLLGRSDKGTVGLSIDQVGLRYEIDPPDTQAGRDTLALLERGDLDASSFGFRAYGGRRGTVRWVDETRDGRVIECRELVEVELLDVGPVTFPAYQAATAGVRSADLPDYLREAAADWERRQAEQVDFTQLEIEMVVGTFHVP